MRILYDSENVRNAIIALFEDPRKRRVAVVAFVGEGAEAYLPSPVGLELFCWPKPGNTDPDTLVGLMKRGAKVSFVDDLHMKVYWSETKGAILTSANLSTGALGSRNLKEVGVLLPPGEFDINRLLRGLRARSPSPEELHRLEKLHKQYKAKNWNQFIGQTRSQSYDEWYESKEYRKTWKMAVISGTVRLASKAKRRAEEEYGRARPQNWVSSKQGDYSKNDWILTFTLDNDRPNDLEWFSVDYFVKVSRSEAAYDGNTCRYVQVWPLSRYTQPPLKLDIRFKKALKESIGEYGRQRLLKQNSSKPPARLIDMIYRHITKKLTPERERSERSTWKKSILSILMNHYPNNTQLSTIYREIGEYITLTDYLKASWKDNLQPRYQVWIRSCLNKLKNEDLARNPKHGYWRYCPP